MRLIHTHRRQTHLALGCYLGILGSELGFLSFDALTFFFFLSLALLCFKSALCLDLLLRLSGSLYDNKHAYIPAISIKLVYGTPLPVWRPARVPSLLAFSQS